MDGLGTFRRRLVVIAAAGSLLAGGCQAAQSSGAPPSATSGTSVGSVAPSQATGAAPDKPFKIGLLATMTGGAASYGQPGVNAAKQALADINAAGGVFGKPVELVVADTGSASEQAVSEARRLVTTEGVQVLLDDGGSGLCLAVKVSVSVPLKIMQLGAGCVSPVHTTDQSNKTGWFFRIRPPISGMMGAIAKSVAADGINKVCVVYVDNPYGQSGKSSFEKSFLSLRPTGSVQSVGLPDSPAPSRLAEAQQCTADGHKTLVTPSFNEGVLDTFLKDGLENGLVDKVYFTEDQEGPYLFDKLGYEPFDGDKGFSGSALPGPGYDYFLSNYIKLYGSAPPVALQEDTYDGVILASLAAAKANSNDPVKIRDQMYEVANAPGEKVTFGVEELKKALQLIAEGKDIDYFGVTGHQEFGENGEQLVGGTKLWHVDAAQKKLVTDGNIEYNSIDQSFKFSPVEGCKYCNPF